jgi:MFS superfamily sulfate permease-like transporter
MTRHTGIRLAEVGFLLTLIAGVWLVVAEILNAAKWSKFRTIVSGVLLAIAGLLLILATHWGHFGGK